MSATPRPLIIKIDALRRRRADHITAHLSAAGFQVINAVTIKEGVKLGERATPQLIIAVDNLRSGIDAEQWLLEQHNGQSSRLAMIPLIMLADRRRVDALRIHELPDRVMVLDASIDVSALEAQIRHLLMLWGL